MTETMVKSVVGDETRMRCAEDRLSQSPIPVQVGLVVGKLSPGLHRGFVYDLVPTPATDGGQPACSLPPDTPAPGSGDKKKGGAKGGGRSLAEASPPPTLVVDADWVAEHARQVSRMLLGGMHVVGIYVWASEASFRASTSILCQTINEVARAAPFYYESDLDERLLIHISYNPRRWSCRNCIRASNNTLPSLRPCDFKMGKLLASLQTFRCFYNFEMRMPVLAFKANTFKDLLQNGINYHAKELKNMKALIDGNLVSEDSQCASEGLHEVELLLSFMKDAPSEVCSLEEVVGAVIFHGTIYASAYLGPKEPISQAISDIKEDIITSLRSRLDIICDAAEGYTESPVNGTGEASRDLSDENSGHKLILHELRKSHTLSFPRRVIVPWIADVSICDYLQPFETLEDLKDHCKEMMSLETPTDGEAMLDPEREAATPMAVQSFWDKMMMVSGNNAAAAASPAACSRSGNCHAEGVPGSNKCNPNILIPIAVLLLSILLGWGVVTLGPTVRFIH